MNKRKINEITNREEEEEKKFNNKEDRDHKALSVSLSVIDTERNTDLS